MASWKELIVWSKPQKPEPEGTVQTNILSPWSIYSPASYASTCPKSLCIYPLETARSPTKFIPIGTDHCLSQLVQPRPDRLITPQTKNTFQTQSARSVFLAAYKPGSPLLPLDSVVLSIPSNTICCGHLRQVDIPLKTVPFSKYIIYI